MLENTIPANTEIRISSDTVRIAKNSNTSHFSIKSCSNEGIGFKIKTNRPKDYIVEPGIGILMPDQEVTINVKMINKDSLNKPEHRFKLDFCYFDWRKTVGELKEHIKNVKVKKLERRMDVVFVGSENLEREDNLIEKAGYVFLGLVFLNLIKVMLQ